MVHLGHIWAGHSYFDVVIWYEWGIRLRFEQSEHKKYQCSVIIQQCLLKFSRITLCHAVKFVYQYFKKLSSFSTFMYLKIFWVHFIQIIWPLKWKILSSYILVPSVRLVPNIAILWPSVDNMNIGNECKPAIQAILHISFSRCRYLPLINTIPLIKRK